MEQVSSSRNFSKVVLLPPSAMAHTAAALDRSGPLSIESIGNSYIRGLPGGLPVPYPDPGLTVFGDVMIVIMGTGDVYSDAFAICTSRLLLRFLDRVRDL